MKVSAWYLTISKKGLESTLIGALTKTIRSVLIIWWGKALLLKISEKNCAVITWPQKNIDYLICIWNYNPLTTNESSRYHFYAQKNIDESLLFKKSLDTLSGSKVQGKLSGISRSTTSKKALNLNSKLRLLKEGITLLIEKLRCNTKNGYGIGVILIERVLR